MKNWIKYSAFALFCVLSFWSGRQINEKYTAEVVKKDLSVSGTILAKKTERWLEKCALVSCYRW